MKYIVSYEWHYSAIWLMTLVLLCCYMLLYAQYIFKTCLCTFVEFSFTFYAICNAYIHVMFENQCRIMQVSMHISAFNPFMFNWSLKYMSHYGKHVVS